MTPAQAQQTTDKIFALYRRNGKENYGEHVTQLEHMVQAAQRAEREGYDDEVILAAFFHDIGHLCDAPVGLYGAKQHEKIGGDYLRKQGFSDRMARLVENHVSAKRYLTFAQPNYYAQLSPASRQTLIEQGGRMNEDEAHAFEQDELFELSLKMRQWDEAAKEVDMLTLDLTPYRVRCLRYLISR